jgi:O-antigen/teichoic acid export membrane protein
MKKPHRFKLVRDLAALFSGQFLSRLIGFGTFVMLARIFDPVSYGVLEYVAGLAAVFTVVVEWGTGPIGVREISSNPQRVGLLAAEIPAARLILCLVAIPLMGLTGMLTAPSPEAVGLTWWFAIALLALPFKQDWLFQGKEMMSTAAAGQVVRMAVMLVAVALFVRAAEDLWRVGAVELAAAAISTLYYLVVQQLRVAPVRIRFIKERFQALIRDGFSLGMSSMIWNVIQFAPLFLVANLVGGSQTAWFGASARIVTSLLAFSQIYHFNLYPALARRAAEAAEGMSALVSASFRVVAWGGILLALTLTLFAEPLLTLTLGPDFVSAAPTFSILIWVVPITLLSGHARWTLIAAGYQRYVLTSNIAGAIAAFVVGAVMIPSLGALGAAFATVGSSLAIWIVAHTTARAVVGPLPILFSAVRPALMATACILLVGAFSPNPWLGTIIASVAFLVAAPLVDKKLFSDLQHLVHAKADVGEQAISTS